MKMILKNLLRFINIQLEIHKDGRKKDKLDKIWEAIMFNKPSPKQGINGTVFNLHQYDLDHFWLYLCNEDII